MTKVIGSKQKGAYTLILNKHGECLGFGKILHDLDGSQERVAVENVSDIGDFLRREKQLD
jgi:ribosome biogenesis protein Nip4